MSLLKCFKTALSVYIMFMKTLPWCIGHITLFDAFLLPFQGKEESPVDMDTITLDPEEEVSRWSKKFAEVWQ